MPILLIFIWGSVLFFGIYIFKKIWIKDYRVQIQKVRDRLLLVWVLALSIIIFFIIYKVALYPIVIYSKATRNVTFTEKIIQPFIHILEFFPILFFIIWPIFILSIVAMVVYTIQFSIAIKLSKIETIICIILLFIPIAQWFIPPALVFFRSKGVYAKNKQLTSK